ncbi:hypothetical protein ACOSQ3_027540 [Xanthoceras sorbifolium]
MSITTYIVKMKGIADLLMAAGQTVTERDLIAHILGGIGQEYDPIVASITSKKDDATLQDTQFLLTSFESRLNQFASAATIDLTNAFANIMGRIHKGELPPNFRINNFMGRFRGRGRGRGGRFNNGRAPCQLCGKLGHSATICYHRYDQSGNGYHMFDSISSNHNKFNNTSPQGNIAQQFDYTQESNYHHQNHAYNTMLATSSTVADPSWNVDSWATNYITPEFNNLSISNDYNGNDRIAVGQNFEENSSSRSAEKSPVRTHTPKY